MNNCNIVFSINELRSIIFSFIINNNRCIKCGTCDKDIIEYNSKYCIWCLN